VFKGILQPLIDALKLLRKPFIELYHFNKILYLLRAFLTFLIRLFLWMGLPLKRFEENEYLILWILFLFGLGTYRILIAGWRSTSKFRLFGGWRRLRQAISYEVVLALLIILPFLLNLNLTNNKFRNFFIWGFLLIWIVIMLAETQRAPLDLSEGERELVSGFNTEYGRLLFTFLFLGEYGRILALRSISSLIWNHWHIDVILWFTIWIWLRTCFPRVRYDKIMRFFWKNLLPILIFLWGLFLGLS